MKRLLFVAGAIASAVVLYKTFGEKAGNRLLVGGDKTGNGLVHADGKGNGVLVGGEGNRPAITGHESSGGFTGGGHGAGNG